MSNMAVELSVELTILMALFACAGYMLGRFVPNDGLTVHQTGLLKIKETLQVWAFFQVMIFAFPALDWFMNQIQALARYLIQLF